LRHKTIAQPFASAARVKHVLVSPSSVLISECGAISSAGSPLIGEINTGFNQGRSLMICSRQSRPCRRAALAIAERLAALPISVGVNEIVETSGLGQVELAVLDARRVNSPGSAGRTFSIADKVAKTEASTARPPWI